MSAPESWRPLKDSATAGSRGVSMIFLVMSNELSTPEDPFLPGGI